MAWSFGDSFDLYAAVADMTAGYWDSGTLNALLQAVGSGRFPGSKAIINGTGGGLSLVKLSNVNDAVHHIVCAYQQTAALSGTSVGFNFQLQDGATTQCSIVFRSDGAILLTSGGPTGTTLATYAGAVTAQSTWYGFEFEVVISNTAGSFTVRKNGNTSNDFTLGSLNTRTTANNYANRLAISGQTVVTSQFLDDVLWRSDASSVAWMGDVRCYVRLPVSTASAQFTASPSPSPITLGTTTTASDPTGTSRYTLFTPTVNGSVGTIIVNVNTAFTGNMKCSIFADSANSPGTVLGSATSIVNPAAGNNTFTFGAPVAVTKGAPYWFGVSHDVTAVLSTTSPTTARTSTTVAYASFPTASPTTASVQAQVTSTVNVTPSSNADYVSEAQQDGATTYVFDSNPGDVDFYGIAPIASTPVSVIATTVRGFLAKSDAGARTAAVQLKSGATTVASPTLSLSTTFGWAWRTDTVDPNTGAAWAPAAVNNAQVGPKVIA